MVELHDIAAWAEDVRKMSQTVEEIWQEDCPEFMEKAIVDAIEALDKLKLKLQGCL